MHKNASIPNASDKFLNGLGFVKSNIKESWEEGKSATAESMHAAKKNNASPGRRKSKKKTNNIFGSKKNRPNRKYKADPLDNKVRSKKNGYHGYDVANKITKEDWSKEKSRWTYPKE